MPSRCCVPLCKGNYPTGPKVAIFSFPKNKDELKKWLQAIQRKDFYPNKYTKICELHFTESDFVRDICGYDEKTGKMISASLRVRRLKSTAVPSVFPNYPSCNISKVQCTRKCPEDKRTEREMTSLESGILESMHSFKEYNKCRKLSCLNDIKKCIEHFHVSKFWTVYEDENLNSLFLLHIESEPEPFIQCSVKINSNMDLTVSLEKSPILKLMNDSFPMKIEHFNDLLNILDNAENNLKPKSGHNQVKSSIDLIISLLENIETDENANMVNFIQQQLSVFLSSSNHFRYSTDFLIFSCILKTISPHAYHFIRQSGNITLPHPETLRRICNNLQVSPELELSDENFLMYITDRVNFIDEHEKTIILLIDEIHIKPFFDYKGGSIVGAAFDTNKAATSAFVFMVSSILSPFKEVAYILPVSSVNFETLHAIMKKVILGLENIGLKVICVVTDNNSINGRAMSVFVEPSQRSIVYPHPRDQGRPLFFLIDSVHIFKNIRNNWLNQKNHGTCFFYPDFDDPQNAHFKTASFNALKKIYEIESNEIVTYARGLTLKSLSPTNLERQNVKLVLKIFNKFVIQALLTLGPKYNIPHFADTANFIEIICKWWDIFNVKTCNKGFHQRNVFMEPLNGDESDEKYIFLNKFLIWLDAWENMKCTTGALSKETHKALVQTTHGMLELTRYCIDECRMKYILTGKIQTDCLEARFGKYRQMAGSQYHISIRQLLECEKKLRLQSCVKLELRFCSNVVPLTHFNDEIPDIPYFVKENSDGFKDLPHINIDEAQISKVKPYLPVITYLGGYCSHTVIKKIKCNHCKEKLVLDSNINLDDNYNLVKNLDRGGLKCPSQFVVNLVMFNYIIVNNLYTDFQRFTKLRNQRQVVVKLTLDVLKNKEMVLDFECPNGHDGDNICKLLLYSSTNIILKNLCIKENDNIIKMKEEKKNNKKRKLQTLQK